MPNALEIDFIPVGENSKSGDAIGIRFGDYESGTWKNQTVIVIDGGNADSGATLVNHINEVYKTNKVDRAILTHPDGDHASGLRTVVEECEVGKIWMHRPWNHWSDLKDSIKDGRITRSSFGERLKNAYQFAFDIEQIAKRKGIEIFAPHQGNYFHIKDEKILSILGPGKDFYLSLIKASDKTPHMGIAEGLSKSFAEVEKITAYEDMTMETEHLSDQDEETSSENNMSLILYLTVAGRKVLFTGDAGTMGLYKAIHYALEKQIDLKILDRFQVPHHGSRHNISKGILKYIHAPNAWISCAKKGAPVHPSKIVTNALRRRGIVPLETKGSLLTHHTSNVPMRAGYSEAVPIPFYNMVEIPAD
jgi:beta-lactamase superfamily II metal-dependent hydrolase